MRKKGSVRERTEETKLVLRLAGSRGGITRDKEGSW